MKTNNSTVAQTEQVTSLQLVVFTLDDQRYALPLSSVKQILRVVEITPLPQAPEIILGIVNIRGQVVPVFDIRKRFHLPEREANLSDCLVMAQTKSRAVACVVDEVIGVIGRESSASTQSAAIFPHLDYVKGVIKLDEELVFIHDLDTFLSLEEEETLQGALVP